MAEAARAAAENKATEAEKALAAEREAKLLAEKNAAEKENARLREAAQRAKEQRIKEDPNREAFQTVRTAVKAKTWSAANKLLERIDEKRIDDPAVFTYVDIAIRCARLAEKLGLDRNADPKSVESVMTTTNLPRAFAATGRLLMEDSPLAIAELVAEAHQLQKEMPTFHKLTKGLSERYGVD